MLLALTMLFSGLSLGAIGAVVARAATTPPSPEVDRANASIQLSGTLKAVTCTGEDTVGTPPAPTPYVTYLGTWKGAEGQVVPDPTDYNLSGSLTVTRIQWTINLSTGRGVLTGTATLTNSASTSPVYAGRLTLVTQGVPAAGATVSARGWIVAAIKQPDEAVTPGDDSLIANVEFPSLSPTGGAGRFGDLPGAPIVPDFSVVTNVAPTAQDGVC
jgi:hypothetical protein